MEPRDINLDELGRELHELISRLYPIHRCITGDGVRETLAILDEHVPVEVYEVPTGTQVLDWTVPREWNIRDAYIKDAAGRRLVDYRQSNLHVVHYSRPLRRVVSWDELERHLHTLDEHPTWIPYRTAYYSDTWGFCLSRRQYDELKKQVGRPFEVCIDATLQDGSLTYGEVYLPGESRDEVLLSAHVCHPSLANDNLSGVAVAAYLAKHLSTRRLRYSYRFIFAPGTIGAITWLSRNERNVGRVKHGLVLALLGDGGNTTYKRSRRGDAQIDRAVAHVLAHSESDYSIIDFDPLGYDERQFCSPGFDLPMGCLMRSANGRFPQYHTSADNLDLVKPSSLADSWSKCLSVVEVLENNRVYRNLNPKGEPQLGRRGLYEVFASRGDGAELQQAVLWVLNLADGSRTLLDVAERASLDFSIIHEAAGLLAQHDLLAPCEKTSVQEKLSATAPCVHASPFSGRACPPLRSKHYGPCNRNGGQGEPVK